MSLTNEICCPSAIQLFCHFVCSQLSIHQSTVQQVFYHLLSLQSLWVLLVSYASLADMAALPYLHYISQSGSDAFTYVLLLFKIPCGCRIIIVIFLDDVSALSGIAVLLMWMNCNKRQYGSGILQYIMANYTKPYKSVIRLDPTFYVVTCYCTFFLRNPEFKTSSHNDFNSYPVTINVPNYISDPKAMLFHCYQS